MKLAFIFLVFVIAEVLAKNCAVSYSALDPCDDKVQFYIENERINFDDTTNELAKSTYDGSLPTKVIIHGSDQDHIAPNVEDLRYSYYVNETRKLNVITVNYSSLADSDCYKDGDLDYVGKCIAKFINALGSKRIHAIGYSHGGRILFYVGKHYKPCKLPRMTALDPTDQTPSLADMADFVDVIHSIYYHNGRQIGDADFYLNFGNLVQPGCEKKSQEKLCSHRRSIRTFTESVTTQIGFYGRPCENIASNGTKLLCNEGPYFLMGEFISESTRGRFDVETNSNYPFAQGKRQNV